ncbi:MAG: 4Fe-4S binding protein [Chloroflexi bacterium]|nr:4Fe-4S binding protein [Chloroflexota bacterium]
MSEVSSQPEASRASIGSGSGQSEEPEAADVLLLLCQDLATTGFGLPLDEIGKRLKAANPTLAVGVIPNLCHNPTEVSRSVATQVGSVVLGVCSSDYAEPEIRNAVRRQGVDPGGLQAANLGAFCCDVTDTQAAMEKAWVLLAGAVARARAYPGSTPDNLYPTLAPLSRKVSRRGLFTMPPVQYQTVVSVDSQRCAAVLGCDLCIQACPKRALRREGENLLVERWQCSGCGICMATCPREAIELPGSSTAEIDAHLTAILQATTPPEVGILFACPGSLKRLESADEKWLSRSTGWLPVTVPCVGMVPVSCILQCLARGAGAVALLPCQANCPGSQREAIQGRVDYCRLLLVALGGSGDRVLLEPSISLDGNPAEALHGGHASQVQAGERLGTTLFGPEAASRAIEALAEEYGAPSEARVRHASSPLGVVSVDPDRCTGCSVCAEACPTEALKFTRNEAEVTLTFNSRLCVACDRCVAVCPEGAEEAIQMEHLTQLARLREGRATVYRDSQPRCDSCGNPVATTTMLARVLALLGEEDTPLAHRISRRCLSCRSLPC